MKVKRFLAKDTRAAMRLVRETLGGDAVILSSKTHPEGVELIAAIDFKEPLLEKVQQEQQQAKLIPALPAQSIMHQESVEPQSFDIETREEKVLQNLCAEVYSLKSLLQEQMSGLVWGNLKRKKPVEVTLIQHLSAAGFTGNLIRKVVQTVPEDAGLDTAFAHCQDVLKASINHHEVDWMLSGGVHAFLGQSGAGKSLCIAKIASQFILKFQATDVAIVSLDNKKIGAGEQLSIYGKILSVPVRLVDDKQGLRAALAEFKFKKLVLIDTPAVHSKEEFERFLSPLEDLGLQVQSHLVLPATLQLKVLEQSIAIFKSLALSTCLISKCDEALSLGEVLSAVISAQLAVKYISDGKAIPGDLRLSHPEALINRALDLAKKSKTVMCDEQLAQIFTEIN